MDEIERLNQDKFFGGLYDAREEHRKMEVTAKKFGYDEGLQEGHDIGSIEKTKEIATNMIKENIDINIISKVTNLSIDEINNIVKENKD